MRHSLSGSAKKITAYLGEEDMYEGRPLSQVLMETARIQGCAGATLMKARGGFGPSSRDIERHGFRMSSDCPVTLEVIDEESRIRALGEVWSTMMSTGLITVEDVHVVYYQVAPEGTVQ